MSGIFISYRVGQTGAVAHVLFERLVDHFGPEAVYLDARSIAPGEDFSRSLYTRLVGSDVVVAVIGPDWTTVSGTDGRPKIMNENDFVRRELAEALARNIPVIPLLVESARMPARDELPADLQSLAHRQYVHLRVRDGDQAVNQLVDSIKALVSELRHRQGPVNRGPTPGTIAGGVIANINVGGMNHISINDVERR
ncbi:hypothetical protein Rhe02_37670 [Rhizocola hellebori]|uniref:TIR domain-containing protein n=1 Tax=Rhizocola hellebori TaxID=1392758 RepID=A0A8J3Q8A9_9ACTN|nr:toll/interleukin-1 receptor domain-containing protein [Rhizocola hellebori]GIH05700.1 hypothetical protein Rhe02_37670 [Rhizocola hellebori]